MLRALLFAALLCAACGPVRPEIGDRVAAALNAPAIAWIVDSGAASGPPDDVADLGADLAGVGDIDPSGLVVAGNAALGQALARRLTTPRGGLVYDDDYGLDCRDWLNAGLTSQRARELAGAVRREALKDERVLDVAVSLAFSQATSVLTLSLRVTTSDGPFDLVVAVSALSVAILRPT